MMIHGAPPLPRRRWCRGGPEYRTTLTMRAAPRALTPSQARRSNRLPGSAQQPEGSHPIEPPPTWVIVSMRSDRQGSCFSSVIVAVHMRRLAAPLVSAALLATACTAANVPSSTDARSVTNVGSVQIQRPAAAEPSAPIVRQNELNDGLPSSNPPAGRTSARPQPSEPAPGTTQVTPGTQPAPDGCGSGTGFHSKARPLCPPP